MCWATFSRGAGLAVGGGVPEKTYFSACDRVLASNVHTCQAQCLLRERDVEREINIEQKYFNLMNYIVWNFWIKIYFNHFAAKNGLRRLTLRKDVALVRGDAVIGVSGRDPSREAALKSQAHAHVMEHSASVRVRAADRKLPLENRPFCHSECYLIYGPEWNPTPWYHIQEK